MKADDIQVYLEQSLLFRNLDAEQLAAIASQATVKHVAEGEVVHRAGDEADTFYVVGVGEMELLIEGEDGVKTIVGRVGAGGHFGETSLLTNKPQALTIRSLCESVLICFKAPFFKKLLRKHRIVQERIEAALAERLRIAFQNQAAGALACDISTREEIRVADMMPIVGMGQDNGAANGSDQERVMRSQCAREIQAAIKTFAKIDEPILLTGESGTGRRMMAKHIHLQGKQAQGPYIEIDVRDYNGDELAEKLFGVKNDPFPFSRVRQTGLLEQFCLGTIVLRHLERIPPSVQERLAEAIKTMTFSRIGEDRQIALQARLIFTSDLSPEKLKENESISKTLDDILAPHSFHVAPLRFHKRDLPAFIDYFVHRFSREYGKDISQVSPETLGILMNYDWPGNLTELSAVIQRAVMLARDDELHSDHILLGLPKSEGKWEFNLLRIGWVRSLFESRLYPALPRAVVGIVLLIAVATLFFGPTDPEKNIGITLSWVIGWPLLFFSFFFLARTWCSVCTLAMPGTLLQYAIKPKRPTPQFIKNYSGWLMSALCILVFWVEIVFNAYERPILSGWIILGITIGSIFFSIFYKRRTWCRYLCPLGAINAIFAMPSILELRSNRHLCLNRCTDHACYTGLEDQEGCPMFRHPFMVDNNRDCIVCGQCIKQCKKHSIHLNVRMAPQELWDIEAPRQADSFLIVALGAIFFPFALHQDLYQWIYWLQQTYPHGFGRLPFALIGSLIFFGLIFLFQLGYYLMVQVQAKLTRVDRTMLLPLLGYGFIPIILGVYLAVHFEIFVSQSWRLVANIREILAMAPIEAGARLISPDASALLQVFTVAGGFFASLYATHRIIDRLKGGGVTTRDLILPYSFLAGFTILFIFFMKTSEIILF
ncbi:sigma 54-interacting transcriptional regulator [Desulfofustis glycolicus]|uniref:4Fe-4S binding domain-containing protein n=1 Tax=Desulfofustis glycolicus DSM 9705 TaxID=1121409 RepID=A0A1M5XE53_9BACT|nr:sigma 54-interacting transcriptional regulator [Desulfofustis glycolicus]MCB2218531.1 sigma 54-interacting transcriptional regulator [Desulfobulbaceae bacterium]SHH98091.1 4Fe-4S binding domain-containing protein [Desulfofustis glycolicus DSM 9705]